METKNQKFVRLANARTQKAINALQSLGNLANRNHYEFTSEEANEILSAIKREYDLLKFKLQDERRSKKFSLGSKYKERT